MEENHCSSTSVFVCVFVCVCVCVCVCVWINSSTIIRQINLVSVLIS